MHRLFVDEAGHEDMKACDDPNQRYLGITGVIMDIGHEQREFTNNLTAIKRGVFHRPDMVLHRREILERKPAPYDLLKDDATRERFNTECLNLIRDSRYTAITVVIDKAEHQRMYSLWRFHPYHYCMTCLIERYVLFLKRRNLVGDVMFEGRSKKQNKRLVKSYRRLYRRGTDQLSSRDAQRYLTSAELKIQPKTANVSGLQLADLIASPLCRDMICLHTAQAMSAEFGRRIVEIIRRDKYDRSASGRIEGYGTKWLPK